MKYIFEDKSLSGVTGYILFLHNRDVKDISQKIVQDCLDIQSYFTKYYCNKIVVNVVNSYKVHRHINGEDYDSIYFYGGGFHGEDIHYAISRFRRQLKPLPQYRSCSEDELNVYSYRLIDGSGVGLLPVQPGTQ